MKITIVTAPDGSQELLLSQTGHDERKRVQVIEKARATILATYHATTTRS